MWKEKLLGSDVQKLHPFPFTLQVEPQGNVTAQVSVTYLGPAEEAKVVHGIKILVIISPPGKEKSPPKTTPQRNNEPESRSGNILKRMLTTSCCRSSETPKEAK